MKKEYINLPQSISTLVLFSFGSSVVMGVNTGAGQDSWLAIIFAALLCVPLYMMYARLLHLFPEQDVFSISTTVFGRVGGMLFTLLMGWYCLHLGALVLRNFAEFIEIIAMPQTPKFPMYLIMLFVAVYLAKSGVQALGRWNIIALYIVSGIVLLTILLSLDHMHISHLKPILNTPPRELTLNTLNLVAFPFAESVVFLAFGSSIAPKTRVYKLLGGALFFSQLVLVLIVVRNIMSLGIPTMQASLFPSYTSAKIINIGDYVARIEGSISVNFILAGVTKTTVCLLAATKALMHLSGAKEHQRLVVPTALLMLTLSVIVYSSATEMFDFIKVYPIYAFPFQIALPVILWLCAEIHVRIQRRRAQKNAA